METVVIQSKRRKFLLTAGVLLVAPFARAQDPERVHRIGFLGNSTAAKEANLVGPFREGLSDLGYVEGRNLQTEYRWAGGKYERFPALVAELAALNIEVIVTAGTPASVAVKKTAPSIPLVMVAVGDPVGTGLVVSLRRPGGNVTGVSSMAPDLEGKRLELLRQVVPTLARVAVLRNPKNLFHAGSSVQTEISARAMGIKVQFFDARSSGELPEAFAAIAKDHPDALVVLADRVFLHYRQSIMDFAAKNRLPTILTHQELVDSGGLMSFGPNYPDMHRRAATYVAKILKGAKPSDLPIEQPTQFETVINLKTAKLLNITIPQSILLFADRIIE